MKKNILLKSFVLGILFVGLSVKAMPIASIQSHEDSTEVIATAQLSKFEVAPDLQITPNEGVLIIKHQEIVIKLVESPVDCTLVACGADAEKEINIVVPLINVSKNDCGVIEYVGFKNQLSSDGARTAVVVTDYTHNTCPIVASYKGLPDTKVELDMEYFSHREGRSIKANSRFDGQSLEAVNTVF